MIARVVGFGDPITPNVRTFSISPKQGFCFEL